MRLSITAKVFTAFTVVLVVFALTSAHSVWQLGRLQGNVRLIERGHLRAMLALTALWAPANRPDRLPDALTKAVTRWLEAARAPALDKLWGLSGGAT